MQGVCDPALMDKCAMQSGCMSTGIPLSAKASFDSAQAPPVRQETLCVAHQMTPRFCSYDTGSTSDDLDFPHLCKAFHIPCSMPMQGLCARDIAFILG